MEILEMSLVMGMMLSVFLTLGFYVLRGIFYVPFIRRRLVETAEREGHMVQARLLKQREVYEEHPKLGYTGSGKQRALYQYECQGKTYRYSYTTRGSVPEELTLYFLSCPRKACLSHELGLWEFRWFWYYIVFSLASAVLFFRTLTMNGGV